MWRKRLLLDASNVVFYIFWFTEFWRVLLLIYMCNETKMIVGLVTKRELKTFRYTGSSRPAKPKSFFMSVGKMYFSIGCSKTFRSRKTMLSAVLLDMKKGAKNHDRLVAKLADELMTWPEILHVILMLRQSHANVKSDKRQLIVLYTVCTQISDMKEKASRSKRLCTWYSKDKNFGFDVQPRSGN